MIKRIIRSLYFAVILFCSYIYDGYRYFLYSSSSTSRLTDSQLKFRIFQKAHSVEKGLALPNVRPGFGIAAISELKILISEFENRSLSSDDLSYRSARSAIQAYLAFHRGFGFPLPDELGCLDQFAGIEDSDVGGYRHIFRSAQIELFKGDFASLATARQSVRDFADGVPDICLINRALDLARTAPSVCNRQGTRVRIVSNKQLLSAILALQGGNRGFTDCIPMVIIVTSEIGMFRGARERNQSWFDSGLFSMNLLYSLSYVGLGCCSLNWSASVRQDIALREVIDIPKSENVSLIIAVGYLKDEYRVATSARLSVTSLIKGVYE